MTGRDWASSVSCRWFLAIFCQLICAGLMSFLSPAAPAAESDGDWVDYRTVGRFQIRAEFRLDRYRELVEFLDGIGEHEDDIIATLGISRSESPILISIFQNRRSYQRGIQREAPEGLRRQAVFIQKPDHGRLYVFLHPQVLTDLRHETTHAILHATLPFLPLWLDEGLAEYFEVPAVERASGHPHLSRVQWALRLGGRADMARLEKLESLQQMDGTDYREAWAWTHFLLHGPRAGSDALRQYLKQIEEHTPPGPLSQTLAATLGTPERQLSQHFKSWR